MYYKEKQKEIKIKRISDEGNYNYINETEIKINTNVPYVGKGMKIKIG